MVSCCIRSLVDTEPFQVSQAAVFFLYTQHARCWPQSLSSTAAIRQSHTLRQVLRNGSHILQAKHEIVRRMTHFECSGGMRNL